MAVIGYREILKAASEGKLEKIIVARNCPSSIKVKLNSSGVPVEEFSGDEMELAVKYGKPFPVSSVGVEKE